MWDRLPADVVALVFAFDPTYHRDQHRRVLASVPRPQRIRRGEFFTMIVGSTARKPRFAKLLYRLRGKLMWEMVQYKSRAQCRAAMCAIRRSHDDDAHDD